MMRKQEFTIKSFTACNDSGQCHIPDTAQPFDSQCKIKMALFLKKTGMLYKTSIRNLLKHKITSTIQITGLMVGFAAFILIFLVIRYEESFDTFHAGKDRIYRTVRIGRNALPGELRTGVPAPVTAGLRADLPALAKVAAIYPDYDVQVIVASTGKADTKKFKQVSGFFYAEPEFFQMFNFGLAVGDIKTAI